MNKGIISFSMFLEYLYNGFSITFLMCLIGVIIKEYFSSVKNTKLIPITKIILTSIFSTMLMCAIYQYFNIPFSLYILFCVIAGIWGEYFIKVITNSMLIKVLVKYMKNNIKDPVAKSIVQTVEELDSRNKENSDLDKDNKDTDKKQEKDQTEV